MSAAADASREPELPPEWERVERVAREVGAALTGWRSRALEAEAEVARLRRALDELAADPGEGGAGTAGQVRRLRAENAALRSRMGEARERVRGLLSRLGTLESRR